MKKSVIITNGVAILSFLFKSEQLQALADEFHKLPKEDREAFLEKYKDKEFTMFREVSSIEIIQRSVTSSFILNQSDLAEIEKMANHVKYQEVAKETLETYLFS